MALVLQDFAAGQTDYIVRLNNNNSATKTAVEALQTGKQDLTAKGQANGYAGLDGNAKLGIASLPSTVQLTDQKGAPNGYAGLDGGGTVPLSQLPAAIQDLAGTGSIDLGGYQLKSAKGLANGYAGLDSGGKVPKAQLPADVVFTAGLSAYESTAHASSTYATQAALDALAGASAPATQPVLIPVFYPGQPAASAVLLAFLPTVNVTIPAALAGSRCKMGTNPTAQVVLTVKKNGASVGTITIATNGAVTLAAAAPISLTTADELTVEAPGSQDATLADLRFTLHGTR